MGFLDRFKKKEAVKNEEIKKELLTLNYSDGTVADISFDGLCDVEGKRLHTARIMYTDKDGTFSTRSTLLEPITTKDENGNMIDSTEAYYRWMTTRDSTKESAERYAAVKGFFKKQEITEEKMGSNYIGNIAQMENGQYYRYFDQDFKRQHTQRFKEQNIRKVEEQKQRDNDFMQNLRNEVYDKPVNIKTSHAEHLTPEMNPYENR